MDSRVQSGFIQILAGELPISVSIDGEEMGLTPIRTSGLTPGTHQVRLTGESFDQIMEVAIRSNEITVLSINPSTRQLCLSSTIMPDTSQNSVPEKSESFNLLTILGIFLGMTLTGGFATLIFARHQKKARTRNEQIHTDSSVLTNPSPGVRIEVIRTKKKKGDVVFDPLMMICDEGSVGEVKVKATNYGSRPVQIEGQTVPDGESRYIIIMVPTGEPGDHHYSRDLLFLDGAGREFVKSVVMRYRVRPKDPSLDWSFTRFICGKMGINAVIRMKNFSPCQVDAGNTEIPPNSEGNIKILLANPDDDQPEVNHLVEVNYGSGNHLILPITIPYNRGIILKGEKQLDEALEYYTKLFSREAGSSDLWVQHGQVLEKLGRPEEARMSYQQGLEIDPANLNAKNAFNHPGTVDR